MRRDVAVVGSMRSGKDSVAAYLREIAGYQRLAFADALKEEVAYALTKAEVFKSSRLKLPFSEMRPVLVEDLNANKKLFRPLLQWWGTEYRRAQDDDYWVKQTVAKINKENRWVCTDGRFVNELSALRDRGFLIVRLQMPDAELIAYLRSKGLTEEQITAQMNHPSELEWRDFPVDYEFTSHFGNLPELADSVAWATGNVSVLGESYEFFEKMYPEIYLPEKRPVRV